MKLYCRIEKQEATETFVIKEGPCQLPQNSSTISNLNLLDDNNLKLFGWVPVEQITENKPIFISVCYEIFEDKVIETTVTRDKTEEEICQETETMNCLLWQNLRQQRNELLTESDKLITIDKWERMSIEDKQKLIEYRQNLRDLPAQYIDPTLIIFPAL